VAPRCPCPSGQAGATSPRSPDSYRDRCGLSATIPGRCQHMLILCKKNLLRKRISSITGACLCKSETCVYLSSKQSTNLCLKIEAMNDKQTPLQIDGISESIYAGFWTRLGSLLLDFIFVLPFTFLVLYLNGLGKNIYFYTIIPILSFSLWYHIYLPKKYGGTPGKLVVGIRIIKLDGQSIGWKEAILRHIVSFALTILSSVSMIIGLLEADEEIFTRLSWLQQSQYLMSLSPILFKFNAWTSNIWFYSELVVLLTNKRKRAIHDFIAGTVIVRTKYLDKIEEVMDLDKPTQENMGTLNLTFDNVTFYNQENFFVNAEILTDKNDVEPKMKLGLKEISKGSSATFTMENIDLGSYYVRYDLVIGSNVYRKNNIEPIQINNWLPIKIKI
jgi:uncharacterized RDD family membrane protein YckC